MHHPNASTELLLTSSIDGCVAGVAGTTDPSMTCEAECEDECLFDYGNMIQVNMEWMWCAT